MFGLSAAASAKEGMCDYLAGERPGLQGLCVALCEAQTCTGIYDPVAEKVKFDRGCDQSAERLYVNFRNLAGEDGPHLACIRYPCPCWAESEIDEIGGRKGNPALDDRCTVGKSFAQLFGFDTTVNNGVELASTIKFDSGGAVCSSMRQTPSDKANPLDNRSRVPLTAGQFQDCKKSIVDECTERGVPINIME